MDVTRRALSEYATWEAMLDRLGAQNESLSLLAGWVDPAYSAFIVIPGRRTLSFHVCFLGPYYGIHRTGAPGEEPAASGIVREIEATYPGYEPIPPELGNEVVPDGLGRGITVWGAPLTRAGDTREPACVVAGAALCRSPAPGDRLRALPHAALALRRLRSRRAQPRQALLYYAASVFTATVSSSSSIWRSISAPRH